MELTNEQLERLIVRSLDGELTDDEQLALDRELIRNPEARALMDEYRDVDSACATALSTWLNTGDRETSRVHLDAPQSPERERRDITANVEKSKNRKVEMEGDAIHSSNGNWQLAIGNSSSIDNRQSTIDKSSSHHPPHRRHWTLLITGAIAAALLAVILPRPTMNPNENAKTNHIANSGFVDPSLTNHQPPVIPHSAGGTPMRNAAWTNPATYRGTGREVIGIMGDDGNIYWIEVQRTRTIERAANPLTADKLDQM